MSAVEKKGFVAKVFERSGTNARGAWVARSFKIASPDGTEDPMFFQLGFNTECPFKEGDYIKFNAEPKDDKAMTFVKGTGKVVKNPPKRSSSAAPSGGRSAPQTKDSDLFGQIGGYNTEDDIRRMSYSAARSDAVALVGLLLEHDALPMSKANSKAGTAKRFEEIGAILDKLTVEFFFDAASGRKLDSVDDAGTVEVALDAGLPDDTEGEQVQEDDLDVGLPEVDDDIAF